MRGKLCPGIGGHDQDNVAEIGMTTFVVGETRIVHHLQQYVVDVLMSLLYLVEQQHGVGRLANGIREQTTILIAHVARRRANELGYGMLLGVLAHVEAYQLNA